MPKLIPSLFTKYVLTDLEAASADILTETQLARFTTIRAEIAEQKLALDFDPTNPIKFAQDEAFLKGQMSILDLQLESHNVAIAKLTQQSQSKE